MGMQLSKHRQSPLDDSPQQRNPGWIVKRDIRESQTESRTMRAEKSQTFSMIHHTVASVASKFD